MTICNPTNFLIYFLKIITMKPKIIITLLVTAALSFGIRVNAKAVSANTIENAYEQYAAIDKALTSDDAAGAKEAAGRLISALTDTKDADAAIKAATGISQTSDIKEQRKSFALLTVAMHNLFRNEKAGKTLYIHYCPMAKAYWMDEDKTIHNPYYGKSMPSCGRTTGMVM
ncbi:MAG: DUF3347 domain-containing protein [Bacteroidetes bacterium]|jgi:hypothetical protein|nr:DUF3347 domain-containing protein [Bacteroidota bacterium]